MLYNIISIHALVKRATIINDSYLYGGLYFNPRPRKEGDTFVDILTAGDIPISIHALVKRATQKRSCACYKKPYFNPRPRKEGDG